MKYRLVVTLMVLSTVMTNAQTKKVIFVCEHGAGKSVVAAAFFNKIAKERNLDWQATCRGTDPDKDLGQTTREGLTSDGLLDPTVSPRKLQPEDTAGVERIIVFTTLPAELNSSVKIEDWSSLQNIDSNYCLRRDALIKKINEFFDTLDKQK